MMKALPALCLLLLLGGANARAETPEEWVALGARVHGGFGSFIPAGIRIGLDAVKRLDAKPRELAVVYYSGAKAPCPCIADGVMLATTASVGQGTMQLAAETSPPGTLGVATVRHRKTGTTLRYTIAESWLPRLDEINRTVADPLARYHAVMDAPDLFTVEPLPATGK